MNRASSSAFLLLAFSTTLAAQSGPAQPLLTLQEAVRYALEHNPDLRSAGAETLRRQARVTAARSSLLPQVDLAGDFQRTRLAHGYPPGTPPGLLRFARSTDFASVDTRLLVWDFHKTSLELAAARERVSAAQALSDRRKQEVIFEVARLYLQALTYQDLLQAAESGRNSLASLLERTKELVKAGRAVPVDAFKIQTQIAQLDSESASLEAGRQAALSALAAIMAYEGEIPRLAYSPAGGGSPLPATDENKLFEDALSRRPDLKAAHLELKSAADLQRATRRAYLPRIDFRAMATAYGSENPASFASFIGQMLPSLPVPRISPSAGITDWVVGFHVSMPLFDSGRRAGQVGEAAAQTELARLAEEKLRLAVRRELRTSLAELQAARARVKSMQEAVKEAEEILRNERTKYEVGRTVVNFVLEAEAGVLNSQSLLFQARRSEEIALLSLKLSSGDLDKVPLQGW